MSMQIILHNSLRQKCYGLCNLNLWTCQLANCLIYGLWNDLNILNIRYRVLEYNNFSLINMFEQINVKFLSISYGILINVKMLEKHKVHIYFNFRKFGHQSLEFEKKGQNMDFLDIFYGSIVSYSSLHLPFWVVHI
jgi:hypothetical protein